MSTTVPAHVTAICPGCGRRGIAPVLLAGRRTKCPKCGTQFRIPSLEQTQEQQPPPDPLPREPLVGFDCGVCQTRMSVPPKYVGLKVKCPDCGAATVVPEPPAPRVPDIPQALFDDQYDVYEEQGQPWGSELARRQPKLIAVHCRLCDTLMHARPDHIGEAIACPDCGVETRVEAPETASTPFDVTVEGYEVASAELHEGPSEVTQAYLEPLQRQAAEQVASQHQRPKLPAAPLLVGVMKMLCTPAILSRWLVLSCWLTIAGCLMMYAVTPLMAPAGGPVATYAGAIMGVSLAILAGLIGLLCYGYLSALLVRVVTESSDGNDQLHDLPTTNPTDWFGEAFTIGLGAMAAAAPGYIVGQLAGGMIAAPAGLLSLLLLYPVVLLSQLEVGSPMAVFAPKLARSMLGSLGTWLLFNVQSFCLAMAPLAGAWAVGRLGMLGIVAAVPVVLAAIFVYYRLIGRLAWVLAEHSHEVDSAMRD